MIPESLRSLMDKAKILLLVSHCQEQIHSIAMTEDRPPRKKELSRLHDT